MRRDTRSALLDAAQELFATSGFSGTTIRDLAVAVGIKESSVYNHFPSKQAIFDAILDRAEERLTSVATRFGIPTHDPDAAATHYTSITLDRLNAIANDFMDAWLHDPEIVAARRVLTLEQYRTPQAAHLLREWTVTRPLIFQAAIFAELTRQGIFRSGDPMTIALAFWGPVLAILTTAEEPNNEPEARRLLRSHLEHFRATHLADISDAEGES